ncbi:protocadherin Fat 1-like, partial [Haliotis rubra]|uniref:protocadherin Fat 1-like n=1 Tax=Haliotis rubra TaxID=36100 RepID=UPI001EE5F5D5
MLGHVTDFPPKHRPYNEITYSASGSGLTFFNVNSQTGEVTVVNNLVQDSNTRYQLTVQATDRGASPLSSAQPASVTINVVRNQASPVFVQIPYDTTVLRTAGANTPVITVTATDADTRSPYNEITYGIASMTIDRFRINPTTGEITLTQAIATDSQAQYGVTVFAQDGGNPRRVTYNTFTVGVDRNLNAPFLTNPSGPNFENSTTVLETIGFDYLIYDVDAFDADLSDPYRSLLFSIIGENTASTYFLINRDSGEIRLKSSLLQDTLQTRQYRLIVAVTDGGDPPRPAPSTATITVNVIRNLNTPRWVNDPYSATIDETIGANVNIVNVLAVDDDINAFNRVSYEIIGDSTAPAYFDVTPGGSIIRRQSLQSIPDTRFYLRIVASDNGVPPKTNTTVVSIIINRNLNTPTFSQLLFTTEIDETTEVGTAVLSISATDQDSVPPYNTVEFAQIPNSATGLTFFSLEADTGNVVLRRPLTGNPDSVYEFQALVRDEGVPSREQSQRATVRITVRRNNNAPFFVGSPYSVTINEDQAVGSQILPVVAQDSDVNSPFNQVTLRVIGDEKGPIYFGLANNQINVTRNLILDAENDLRYTLRIEARDGGSPARSATALVYITVNRNLNPPVFTTQAYSARIPETQQLAVSVVQVQATDGDRVAPYNTLRYEISGAPFSTLGRQYFMVDPVTGVVSVRRNLETDTSDTSVYRFIVDAIDGSGVRAPQPANVDITVDRNLFPPVFITTNYTAVINNTTPQGSPVFTALATDGDSTSPFNVVQYSIIGDDGSQSFFSVDATSGAVSLAQPVFNIPNTQFRVRLQAVDGSGLTDVEVLTVFIQRNLFAPVFTQTLYERVIQETIPVSTSILNVFAQDSDQTAPYSTVSYFASGSSDRFLVNVNNGAVTVRRSLIGESGQTFTVYAQDGGTPPLRSQFVTVRINVTRNNFPPVFVNEPYSQSLLATASAGDGVVQVTATDADVEFPFNNVRYDIIGDDNAPAIFQIDESSGQISLRNTFSGDGAELYRIRVRARDGGNPRLSDITVVSVNVTRNLRAPVFNTPTYSARILETINFGEVFISATAQDLDTSAPNNALTYQLTGNTECQRYFGINNNGGLYVQADLVTDPTRATFYTCQVSAQDQGNPRRDSTNQATVGINVIRNTAPEFTNLPYNAVLQRNITTGTVVGTFTVTDSDTDDPFNRVTYSLIGDGLATSLFTVTPDTGSIRTQNTLNSDNSEQYVLRVVAMDGGTPRLTDTSTVLVTVNRNLNAPQLQPQNYSVGILATQALSIPILTINAADADVAAPYNTVQYEVNNLLSSVPGRLYFMVDRNTGAVSLRCFLESDTSYTEVYTIVVDAVDGGGLRANPPANVEITVDRNTTLRPPNDTNSMLPRASLCCQEPLLPYWGGSSKTYIYVRAEDNGSPKLYDIALVELTINRNLNPPIFNPVTYEETILETWPIGDVVLRVTASDADNLIYVRAEDNGSPKLYDIALVELTINRNLNPPIFNPVTYEETILETWPIGDVVLRVTASDADNLIHVMAARLPVPTLTKLTCVLLVYVKLTTQVTPPPCNPGDNLYAPVFINSEVQQTIPETLPVDARVATLSALDNDTLCNFGSLTYSIIGDGSAATYFRIEKDTGTVSLKTSLTNTSIVDFTVRIEVQDGSSPPWSSTALLYLKIARNFERPVWSSATYTTNIPETVPVLATILRVTATDRDAQRPNNEVTYELVGDAVQLYYFEIVSSTGDIRPRRPLTSDTNRRSQFDFVVIARDKGSPPLTAAFNASVTISVFRNNNAPRFIQDPYSITVSQGLGSDTVISVRAVDDDPTTEFNQITYSIEGPANALALFTIDGSGNIQPTNPASINSASETNYKIYVRAEDNGSPRLYDIALVELTINRNLNPPIFNPVTYGMTILDNRPIGDVVLRVTASDADNLAPYNQVRYALTGNSTVLQFFQVNTVSNVGTVSLKRAIYDYPDNTVTQLQFQVTCEDLGNPSQAASNSATVLVTIVRNTPPFFDGIPYSTVIPATQAADTSVFQVAARDNDVDAPFNEISLSLLGDSNTPSYFTLSQTGLISVRSGVNLTTDTRTNYVARVQVRDGGTPSLTSTALVAISVTRNFFAPVFSNSRVQETIPETTPVGTTVTTLTASDRDTVAPNGNFQYRLVSGTGVGFFYVDPNNGQVVLLRSVDGLSTLRFFTLNVEARDEGTPSLFATAIVEVSISFDPDQLVFGAGEYNITLSENTPVNTIITQVQAQPQAGVVYTVTGLSSGPDFFLVGGSTGQVRVRTLLTSDAAELTGYRLRVRATRTGVTSQTAFTTVNIIVNRNINAPVFDRAQYLITIPDTTPLGSVLDTVRATDADGDVIEYTLLTGQPASDFFLVGPRDGSITLKTTLMGTTQNVYQFTIQADDQKVPRQKTSTVQVTVNITRDAGAPRFIGIPYFVNIREDVAESSSIFTVTATDDDLRGQIEFVTIGQGVAEAFFTLNTQPAHNPRESFVIVRDTSALRNDVTQQYTLRVRAYDTAYPNNPATSDVTINIERNLNRLQFSSQRYQVTIYATQVLGVPIIQVNASDAGGDNLMFEITGSSQAQVFYNINPLTGEIYVKRSLLEGNQLNDQISLRVRDQRTPEKYGTAEVDVTIKRDRFTPEFQNQPYIRNNFPYRSNINDNVQTVLVTDRDLEGTIVYEVTGVYPAPSFFRVNNETGLVDLSQQLTTISGDYRLRVIAYDSFYPNNAATSTVTILVDTNPNTPICNPPVISQSLDTGSLLTPVGFVIGTVNATDADGDQISYSMVNGDPEDYRYFIVDPTDGTLRLREPIDNTFTGFNFQIQASDRGVPTAKVCTTFVSITVQRDDAPFFVNEPYSNTIDETVTTGTPVFRVEAQDNNLKGRIVYGLVGDLRAPYFFTINDTNGIITLRNSIRTDTFMSYKARVTAYDSGSTTRTATATVDLTVNRNAGQPAFGLPSYDTTIEELTAVGTSIINVTATDSDQDVLRYTLEGNPVSVNGLQYFGINSNTGKISVIRPLTADVARTSQYVMTVRVTDQRQPVEKSSTAQVTVNVLRNLNKPYFRNNPYSRQISELTTVSTSIITVTAVDDDLKGDLILDIVGEGSAPSYFSLTPATRVATTRNAQVDLRNSVRSDRGQFQYVLVVRAYDSFYPQDFVEERVVIDVTRNEFAPEYINTPYRVTIDEDTPVGRAVIDVNATDRNGDRIYYAAYGEADTMQLFQLDPNSGVVTLIRPLVPGTQMQYTMRVNATDGGLPERWTPVEVIITIRRDQFAPIFIGNYQTNVFETQAVPSDVPIVVQATDQDGVVGQIVYKATGIYPALSFFEVDGTSGQIRLIRDLKMDFSKPNPYLLEVTAEDSARPRKMGTATVTINIIRNPNTPQWGLRSYSANIPEDYPVPGPVVNVTATDLDAGDKIRYSLNSEVIQRDVSIGPIGYFYIDTDIGLISLRRSVLGSGIRQFTLGITACDNGYPVRCINTTAVITINRDGQSPVWQNSPYNVQIQETHAAGTFVLSVRAVDPDLKPGSQVVYEFLNRPAFFALDELSGNITLENSVLFDSNTQYNFQVRAYDRLDKPRSVTADVTVFVIRNANAPSFLRQPYQTTISEYYTVGSEVLNTTAVDLDGDVPLYSFVNPTNEFASKFYIDPRDGIIYLRSSMERTPITLYNVTISATDQRLVSPRSSSTYAEIRVDLDDTPQFTQNPYNRPIQESFTVGNSVITVQAVDPDLQGDIRYGIDGLYPAESFF